MSRFQRVEKHFARFYIDADTVSTYGVKDRQTGEWVVTELRDIHEAREERARVELEAHAKGEET